jgi:hypothetical protein
MPDSINRLIRKGLAHSGGLGLEPLVRTRTPVTPSGIDTPLANR